MTPEIDAITKVAQILAGPVGTFFVIVLVGVAISTKRYVPGWIYEECVAESKAFKAEIAARVARSEADLEQLRRDRMGQPRV